MTLRIPFLLLVGVLLAGAHATAATPKVSATQPFCAADLATPEFPNWSPSSASQSFVGIRCGGCSQSICQGARLASICGISGTEYEYCADVGICSQDGTTSCFCKTGPPL